jgi:uncharacterized protein YjbJ (UPF0337 family)
MKRDHLIVNFLQRAYQLVATFACLVVLTLGWQGVFTISAPAAMAGNDMVQYERQNAQEQIDRAFGAGTSDQSEGKIDQAYGNVQRQFGKTSGQAEGAARQAQGQAKEGIGRAKSAIDRAGSEAQDQGGNLIDSVKDFFD